MKKLVFLALAACLAVGVVACKKSKVIASDGYYFEQSTFTRLEPGVTIVLVKDQTEMTQLLKDHGRTIQEGREVAAFSVLEVKESKCTIYMIDPKDSYQPEFIGHELVHCIYGVWHPSQL
jgi:hypothetical protein